MKRRNLIARALVFCEVLLASCVDQPTAPKVPTAEESFSRGLWFLATQTRPIEVTDIAKALDLKPDDYEDSLPATNAWKPGLLLKKPTRDEPGQNMLRTVGLSKVENYSLYLPASKKPAKPRTQVIRIILQAPFCIDGEALAKTLGVGVRREFYLGYADVTPATLNVISHESGQADGMILIGVGCTRFVTVRLAFAE